MRDPIPRGCQRPSATLPDRVWDAAVVGAGPARGYHALLLDREAFPREKVCGDGLLPDALVALDRLGLREAVARAGRTWAVVSVWSPGRVPVDAPGEVLTLRRSALDHLLAARAAVLGAAFARGEPWAWRRTPGPRSACRSPAPPARGRPTARRPLCPVLSRAARDHSSGRQEGEAVAVLEAIRVQRLLFEATGELPAEARQTPCEIRAHVRGLGDGRASVLLVVRFFEGDPKPPFRLELAVEGRFQMETGETAESLAKGAGPASLYPYLRDEVAHVTLRAGLAPLLLPPLRLAPSAVQVREDVN